ncbi:MAG: DUF3429 domain-containing protein [Pseudomonadota bacterium]
MFSIPRSALILGLAGLIPFFWGALTVLNPDMATWGIANLGPRFVGPYIQLYYGAVILSFMSGVLWGFATRAEGFEETLGYVLSVIPALWAFFMTGGGPTSAATSLIFGYIGLLMLDFYFWQLSLAPPWWMALRVALTALVCASLSIGLIF